MELNEGTNKTEVSIKIPLPTVRHAEIVYDVLRIDQEPKRSSITKTIELDDRFVIINLKGEQSKNVRVGVTGVFENLILVCETLEAFGPPSDLYEHY